MSATNGSTSPSISDAVCSRVSSVRLAIATRAPSRASASAIPRPSPRLAPITSATLPSIPRSTAFTLPPTRRVGWRRWPTPTSTSRSSTAVDGSSAAATPVTARCTRRVPGVRARSPRRRVRPELSQRVSLPRRADPRADPVLERQRQPDRRRRSPRRPRVRGQAPRDDGDETDILATTTPAFVVRNPDDFLELIRLRKPDPETGQPDMQRLGAWLGEHPEAQTAIQGTLGVEPLASFAAAVYYSPHTFWLVDGAGARHAGPLPLDPRRRRAADRRRRGQGAGARLPATTSSRERLADGPIGFELRFQRPAEGDPLDDPTALWPDDRELVAAGRLEITRLVDDPERDGHIDVFDPTRLVDGVEPSDDPILHARRRPTRSPPIAAGIARRPGCTDLVSTPPGLQALPQVRDRRRLRRRGRRRPAIASFGSGANPTGVMIAILALVFGFVAVLIYLQRRDLDAAAARSALEASSRPSRSTTRPLADQMSLLSELATGPIDRDGDRRGERPRLGDRPPLDQLRRGDDGADLLRGRPVAAVRRDLVDRRLRPGDHPLRGLPRRPGAVHAGWHPRPGLRLRRADPGGARTLRDRAPAGQDPPAAGRPAADSPPRSSAPSATRASATGGRSRSGIDGAPDDHRWRAGLAVRGPRTGRAPASRTRRSRVRSRP